MSRHRLPRFVNKLTTVEHSSYSASGQVEYIDGAQDPGGKRYKVRVVMRDCNRLCRVILHESSAS